MKCTYRGCQQRATHTIIPKYGNPWFGCADHLPAMEEAFSFGHMMLDGAEVRELESV